MPSLDAVFSALADPTRRAILSMLLEDDMAVTDVAAPFQMSLAAISKHLAILAEAGLISQEKRGRINWCKLEPDAMRDASSGCKVSAPMKPSISMPSSGFWKPNSTAGQSRSRLNPALLEPPAKTLPQHILLHLAHRVARQIIHHHRRLGLLEPRQIPRNRRQHLA